MAEDNHGPALRDIKKVIDESIKNESCFLLFLTPDRVRMKKIKLVYAELKKYGLVELPENFQDFVKISAKVSKSRRKNF